ncbi:c-type cytochrome [Vibrio sp. 99-70-13A1]|uniref:c-type cytochrome n=1 Tax=Vibrio sp. 99-70-13A1 TaxID=2607601 RepID=UPI0014939E27|nr:c-type cytochrome [Vibrio sp. 99-70-13A1]NOH98544.1 c-type cytochrome [Vibrio sp. 99-70-13A1]
MKIFIFICLSLFSLCCYATSNFELGKQLYTMQEKGGCVNCHGSTGSEPLISTYPKINGQSEEYLVNQLLAFSNKTRKSGLYPLMELVIDEYTVEEIKLIALYLSKVDSESSDSNK